MKPKYFAKAINHFREKYKNPLFLVVSDEVPRAKKTIIEGQNEHNDIFFVGTIDDAIDGKITKNESIGVDLAILSVCDHVIMTHGTFGLWSTFLSSIENQHIIAHDYIKADADIEEVQAVKNANFTHFIFLDDK